MSTTALKAHVFDAEQALTWAREAIEEQDQIATIEALRQAQENITAAVAVAVEHYESARKTD